ncbi:hypothetical protein JCM10908_004086 [Rhodotorula pacifica]|uniref:DMT family transporter n=1 Tax=Rhodotorula pacifica TaxID=1495444 RepID=UPI00317600B0
MSSLTTSIRLDDSPLHGSGAASPVQLAAAEQAPSHRPKSGAADGAESSTRLDDALNDALPSGRYPSTQPNTRAQRGHRTRPSASWLLGSTPDETDFSPEAMERRQRRLRSYGTDDDRRSIARYLPRWQLPTSIRPFVDRNQGLLLIASSQLGFALVNTCVKLLERDVQVPVWELIVIRMFITYAGCYSYLRWSGDPHPFAGPPGVRLLLALRGFIGFFGLYTNYAALQYLSLADASTLWFVSPVLVGILGWLILREPYSRLEALVGLASLSGTVFIAKPTFLFPAKGGITEDLPGHAVTPEQRALAVSIVLFGVVASSGVSIIIRYIGTRASALHSISYFALYSTFVSLMYPVVFHSPPVFRLTTRFFVLLFPIGVLGFLSQTLMTNGLIKEKAGRGALATYTNLLFTMVLERIFFKRYPDIWSILGAVVIIGGAVRVAMERKGATDLPDVVPNGYDPVATAESGLHAGDHDIIVAGGVGRQKA